MKTHIPDESPMKDVMAALMIILPKDSIPVARQIARAARRNAKKLGMPVPVHTDVFSLLAAQPDPLSALLNARAEGIMGELDPSDHQRLLVACRLFRSDMPDDNGILSMAFWSVKDSAEA